MGLWYSCCRRRKPSGEREPLLPKPPPTPPPQPPSLEKLVDVFAALNAGKLPSQDQLNSLLRLFLRSEFLRDEVIPGYGPISQGGRKVVDDLREVVQAALQFGLEKNDDDKIQDLLFHTTQIESRPVEVDAEVIVDVGQQSFEALKEAPPLPSGEELTADLTSLTSSLKSLFLLLLTSTAFRLILSDILGVLRSLVGDLASDVATLAQQVEVGAEKVGEVVRLDDTTVQGLKAKAREVVEHAREVGRERERERGGGDSAVDHARDAVIGRLQEGIIQANRNPKYRDAIQTILLILRKYSYKLSTTASAYSHAAEIAVDVTESPPTIDIAPIISTDPHLVRVLQDGKSLIERAASGVSLDPIMDALVSTITEVANSATTHDPNFQDINLRESLLKISLFFDRALADPRYITSTQGTRAAGYLYDETRALFSSTSTSTAKWAASVRMLLAYSNGFLDALKTDKTTSRLIASIDALSADVLNLGLDGFPSGRAKRKWAEEAVKDIFGWLVPRLLRALRAIAVSLPMPRIEFSNGRFDVALDALLLTGGTGVGASLLPDKVNVQTWNEISIDIVPSDSPPVLLVPTGNGHGDTASTRLEEVQTTSRIRIHMEGIRLSAHNIGYFFRYKGPWGLGYEDEGLLSIDVGVPPSTITYLSTSSTHTEGLSLTIDLKTNSQERKNPEDPYFRVHSISTSIPGLSFSFDKTKHWILNKTLLQPLSGPVVRLVFGKVMEIEVTKGLNAVEQLMRKVVNEVDDQRALREKLYHEKDAPLPSMSDYWEAFTKRLPEAFGSSRSDEEEEQAEDPATAPIVESHTSATLKGIIHTTSTQPNPESSHPPTPEETVISVGVGAQLFPGKGGAYRVHDGDEESPAEAAREIINEAEEGVQAVIQDTRAKRVEVANAVSGGAVHARDQLERAEARKQGREAVERKRRGWQSRAFDF